MHPFLVLSHGHSALTPFNAFAPGQGALGKPVWGPGQLLRDLELRLGLGAGAEVASDSSRTLSWSKRMRALAPEQPFYAASFAIDPLGTAQTVLALRDALRTSGWNGGPVADGGARLDALAKLESLDELAVPLSSADRALSVAAALGTRTQPLYSQLTLADVEGTWPECWRRVFQELRRTGTKLEVAAQLAPQASPDTDLGKVQRALSQHSSTAEPVRLVGDGTFVRVVAETSIEAARATAAFLATLTDASTVVIRDRDVAVLDHALGQHGLASQGLHSASPWRSALQVLPLALELAFAPKDPQRILELLNLPQGPFAGATARYLTRALLRSPGVGGRAWLEAKAKLAALPTERMPADHLAQQMALVETWLETPGADAIAGASKNVLRAVVTRVRVWLIEQVSRHPHDATLRVGVQQCDDLFEAFALEYRDAVDLVHVRRLSEFVMNHGAPLEVTPEQVGRIASVGSPRALYVPTTQVVWWMFSHSYEHTLGSPWRAQERAALAAAHIERPHLELQLVKRAAAFRRSVFAAQKRLILVSPRTTGGQTCASHPLWDELVAKVPLSTAAQATITCSADELLRPGCKQISNVQLEPVTALALPVAHPRWNIPIASPIAARHSASSLSSLLGCPLQWALTTLAGLRSEEQALSSPHLLAGSLGHRLLEILHEGGWFKASAETFRERAEAELDGLVEREGAALLRPGKAHELSQVRGQLIQAACTLKELLSEHGLEIRSVEAPFEIPWREGKLDGRWDILAESLAGQRLLIDVKWGYSKYKDLFARGNALQLATYGHVLRSQAKQADSHDITAAYYSLSTGRLFGVAPNLDGVEVLAGDDLSNTWQRATRTLPLVERSVSQGRLHVSGVTRALPLLETLDVPEPQYPHHYQVPPEQACEYCRYDGLCGRRWEALQ